MEKTQTRTPGHRIKKTLSWFLLVAVTMMVCAIVTLLYLRSQPLPAASVPQTTRILDAGGELIDQMHGGENRRIIALDHISPHLIQATLAIEDHRFFTHFGFDLRGIARAAAVNVANRSKVQGASTLTQQLARNLYLTHDRTWSRKIREAVYTLQLEMQYTKDTILEKYLNEIYYGHAAYGIEAASQLFYGKSASELSLGEAAMLAGIPKGPLYYSPYLNEQNAFDRQHLVLQAMVEHGMISSEEAKQARQETLTFLSREHNSLSHAPYFRDYIRRKAKDILQVSDLILNEGGYQIETTLDLRTQQIAEAVVEKHLDGTKLQAALVAIDPRTGHVKAMVGGRNYEENQYNRVFATSRQPGSAFKPFVYLTALQQDDFTPITRFKSKPTQFLYDEGRKTYTPTNFGNRYPNEDIDLRYAISRSDNIYAVHALMLVGADKVIETTRKLGIQSPMEPLPSLALGTFPVSPFEMASAYGTIANQGARVEPVAITRILDHTGQVLYEAESIEEQVVNPSASYVLTHLMESVFSPGGTAARVAAQVKRPIAGKTGTTNTDAWMVGYTPELSSAVWIGHDRDLKIGPAESRLAAPIFADFMELTLEPIPPKIFPIPEGVVSVYIDPDTGKLATTACPNARLESFIAGTEPTEYCSELDPGELPIGEQEGGTQNGMQQKKSWWENLKQWWTS